MFLPTRLTAFIIFLLVFSLNVFFAISSICDGKLVHSDAIIILPEIGGINSNAHDQNIDKVLSLLFKNYPHSKKADILLWYGDLSKSGYTINPGKKVNFRRCSVPKALNHTLYIDKNHLSNSLDVAFNHHTIFNKLSDMQYIWVMRLDINTEILSKIHVNLFDIMRKRNMLYGYRMVAYGCDNSLSYWLQTHAIVDNITPSKGTYISAYFPVITP